jgi:regulator of sigma E protease
MFIAILVVVGLSLLILGHEAGHFLVAKAFGLKVDEFGFGFPPRITAWKKGETEYSLNWLPFGGFVKISGERGEFAIVDGEHAKTANADSSRLFFAQPAWKKSAIVLAGVGTNFILGWLLISAVLAIGVPKTLVISGTQPDSPAAQVGFQPGDVVKDFKDSQSFIDYVNQHKGQAITIAVIRNNKEIDLTATPRTQVAEGQGALGVELAQGGAERENVLSAVWDGLQAAGQLSWLTILAFYDLIRQLFVHATLPAGVVGPVGIFGIAEETGKIGLTYLLQFIGIISINLMVVNLIPFPALDGGRFVMVIIEKIKGSAVPEKVETYINGIGFALLLTLMVLLTVRDVRGLF